MDFRTLELRDANGNLVCEEPIHQPQADDIHRFVIFNGTRLFKYGYRYIVGDEVEVANYREESALRCGRAVVTDQLTVWQPGLPPSPGFVLACVEDDRGNRTVVRAAYVRQFELVANLEACEAPEYREDDDECYCPEGWYEMNSYEETHWRVEGRVVGWMPLPSPPQAIEGVDTAAIVEAISADDDDDGPVVHRCTRCGALSLDEHRIDGACLCGARGALEVRGVPAEQFRNLLSERDRLTAELERVRREQVTSIDYGQLAPRNSTGRA